MYRQGTQRIFAFAYPVLSKCTTEQPLAARLVTGTVKDEISWISASHITERPAGQNFRQGDDIGLAVAAIDTQRVKLEDFTRWVSAGRARVPTG